MILPLNLKNNNVTTTYAILCKYKVGHVVHNCTRGMTKLLSNPNQCTCIEKSDI